MAKNLIDKLRKLDGAVDTSRDPMVDVLKTPSPSVNWAFGVRGYGLPFGYSMLLFGPPKGGKSIICNSLTGQLHRDDPEAVVVNFNTEMRGALQSSAVASSAFGIDPDRYVCFDVNEPALIFDRIEKDLPDLIQQGLKIKLVIIDSLKGIQGRRAMNATSVNQMQIGDQAATLQDGLMRITPIIRKYGIALVMTTHVRAEMDQLEIMRGNTVKMAAAYAAKHMAELFCYVEPNRSKSGKSNLAGEEFKDEETKDFMDKALKTGHKIRFKVTGNSIGPDGRTAEFTLDYQKGIINQYEEVFTLGKNLGVIEKVNNLTYAYKDQKWAGLKNCLIAIRDDPKLQREILADVYEKDRTHLL
jgi:RecA/RadA recombinase